MKWKLAAFTASLLLFASLVPVKRTSSMYASDSLAEAKRLWELAVTAKGSRQKLHQVNSLAVSYEYRKGQISTEVYVLPDKRWEWLDTGRSSKFPLLVYAMDFEQKIHCFIQGTIAEGCQPIGGYSKRSYLDDPQLLYLLETKWVKPELLGASRDKLGFHDVDIVKVRLEQFEISVYLDAKTHLPSRIAYHSNMSGPNLKVGAIFEWKDLSDYQDVDGVMLPHKISHTHGPTRRLRYEVNPEYDSSIFTRKPDLKAGPEQWRSKKYSSSPKK